MKTEELFSELIDETQQNEHDEMQTEIQESTLIEGIINDRLSDYINTCTEDCMRTTTTFPYPSRITLDIPPLQRTDIVPSYICGACYQEATCYGDISLTYCPFCGASAEHRLPF
jgi:rubrerythrin